MFFTILLAVWLGFSILYFIENMTLLIMLSVKVSKKIKMNNKVKGMIFSVIAFAITSAIPLFHIIMSFVTFINFSKILNIAEKKLLEEAKINNG